jgi:hypothetical protein
MNYDKTEYWLRIALLTISVLCILGSIVLAVQDCEVRRLKALNENLMQQSVHPTVVVIDKDGTPHFAKDRHDD